MREIKNVVKEFSWRTAISGFMMFDRFMFGTGNPSMTYSLFGGYFMIPFAIVAFVTGSYANRVLTGAVPKREFMLHAILLVVLFISLGALGPYASERAKSRL